MACVVQGKVSVDQCVASLGRRTTEGPRGVILPRDSSIHVLRTTSQMLTRRLTIPILLKGRHSVRRLTSQCRLSLSKTRIVCPGGCQVLRSLTRACTSGQGTTKVALRRDHHFLLGRPLCFNTTLMTTKRTTNVMTNVRAPTSRILQTTLRLVKAQSNVSAIDDSFVIIASVVRFNGSNIFIINSNSMVPSPSRCRLTSVTYGYMSQTHQALRVTSPGMTLLSCSAVNDRHNTKTSGIHQTMRVLDSHGISFLCSKRVRTSITLIPTCTTS